MTKEPFINDNKQKILMDNIQERDKYIKSLENRVFYYRSRNHKWASVCGWLIGYSVASMSITYNNSLINNLIRVIILLFGAIFVWFLAEWNIRYHWKTRPVYPRLVRPIDDKTLEEQFKEDMDKTETKRQRGRPKKNG